MDKDRIDDKYISQLICSIEHDEPGIPEIDVLKKSERKTNKNIIYLIRTIAATIILLIGIIFINKSGEIINKEVEKQKKTNEISEIRTDFVIRKDNIKIIWIQKKEFNLNQI